jgi:acetyl-CoA carboxylase biotin carboxyl carrier protein
MDLKEIKRLIDIVETAKVSHFSIETDGTKIEIKKELSQTISQPTSVILPQQQVATNNQLTETISQTPTPVEEKNDPKLIPITSQMVGTCYIAANPESEPYVKVGTHVEVGNVICLIEAMKLFNEIQSEHTGTIEKICVQNGSPVEYGQDLFLLRIE